MMRGVPVDSGGGGGLLLAFLFWCSVGSVVLRCWVSRLGWLWELMRACPYVVTGLRRAGFANGWL